MNRLTITSSPEQIRQRVEEVCAQSLEGLHIFIERHGDFNIKFLPTNRSVGDTAKLPVWKIGEFRFGPRMVGNVCRRIEYAKQIDAFDVMT